MKTKLSKLLERRIVRYLVVGGGAYLFEVIIIVTAQQLGASAVTAVAISFWAGLFLSFGLQKFITFQDKRMHHRILLPQIIAFSLLVLFNFGFTVLVTKLLSPPVPAVISRTISLCITTLWNFYLYKSRIFKSDDTPVY